MQGLRSAPPFNSVAWPGAHPSLQHILGCRRLGHRERWDFAPERTRCAAVQMRAFFQRKRVDNRGGGRLSPDLWAQAKELLRKLLPLIPLFMFSVVSLSQRSRSRRTREMALSAFLDLLEQPVVSGVRYAIIGATRCPLVLDDGRRFRTEWPAAAYPIANELWGALRKANIRVAAEPTSRAPYLVSFVMIAAYLFTMFSIMRRATGGGSGRKGWRNLRREVLQAQEASGSESTVSRFEDISGIDEAKQQMQEVVQMLQRPERYAALGARPPRGVLLTGPPVSSSLA